MLFLMFRTSLVAVVSVTFLWNANYKVNQELEKVQNQLAEVNKQLQLANNGDSKKDVPKGNQENLAVKFEETELRLRAVEIQLGQCITNTTNMVKEIKGTKFNLSEAINKTQIEAWQNMTRDKEETTKYISSNFMSYGK